jgi:hypothetical protein
MIIRHKLRGHFAMIPNAIFHDTRLSIEAKALLAYLLSLPGNWEVRHDQLRRKLGIGRKLLDRCFRELTAAGYAARDEKQGRDKHNRFTTLNYIVQNVPEPPPSEAPEPRRQGPKRPRDSDSNNENNKTDLNNPFSKSLPIEQAGAPKAQQVVYSELGQRALTAGLHPVFVGSKPYEAWCRFRGGADSMPGFVDRARIDGRLREFVWLPSVYPPKHHPAQAAEGGGGW